MIRPGMTEKVQQVYAEPTHKLSVEKAGRLLRLGILLPEEIAVAAGSSALSNFCFIGNYASTWGKNAEHSSKRACLLLPRIYGLLWKHAQRI